MEKQKFCVWIKLEDGHQCTQCGKIKPRQTLRECGKVPVVTAPKKKAALQPRELGDYTESLLESVGITKERYVSAKKYLGLAPTCNCASRRE